MKTKILALVVAAMILFNGSFANDIDKNIKETVLNAFSQQFEKASDVNWIKSTNYYKATFTWNGQVLSAFYGEDGESIAVARNIIATELPLVLQGSLAEDYSGYWITELFEYDSKETSKYYITVENADKKITLESIDKNYWSVYKKSAKA